MRLLSLYASNFKKLRFDEPLKLPGGVTLIAGLNEAGKSSILDAILYALYARVIRPPAERGRTRNEDIIAYGSGEALVQLEFAVGDRKFKVTRRVRKAGSTTARLDEVLEDGSLKPLAAGQEKVTDEIQKLLGGITFNEMISSTVVAQKELNRLIELNKDDRRKVVNAFLNLESFNIVLKSLDERRKELEGTGARVGRIQIERERLESLQGELNEFRDKEGELSRLVEETGKLRSQAAGLKEAYGTKESLHEALSAYYEALQKRESLSLQIEGKRRVLSGFLEQRRRLALDIDSAKQELQKLSDLDQVEATLTRIRAAMDDLRALAGGVREAELTYKRIDQEVKLLESKLPPYLDSSMLEEQLRELKKPIWPYVAGSAVLLTIGFAASVTGSLLVALPFAAIGAFFLALLVLKVSRKAIVGKLEYLDSMRKRRDSEERNLKGLLGRKLSVEQSLIQLCMSVPRYTDAFIKSQVKGVLQASEEVLRLADSDREALNSIKARLSTLKGELAKLPSESELLKMEGEVNGLEGSLRQIVLPELPVGIEFSRELLEQSGREKEELGRKLAECETNIRRNEERIGELTKWLEEHEDIERKVKEQREVVRKHERELKIVRKAIEGIQATAEALRNRIRPSVEGHMGAILPALTSGRYRLARLSEDYNFQVWDPEAGEFRVKDVFSGGTEDQLLLGMRLAFALALLPEVKGQKPEFVFLDEPLGSSDEVRRSGIIEYLNADLAKKFKQIFIISHVGGLEEHVRNVIRLQDGRVIEVQTQ